MSPPQTDPAPDVRGALDALDGYPAFFAYNANVDAIAAVGETVERALDPPAEGPPPARLGTPRDLSTGLAASMESGHGDEIPVSDDLAAWLESALEPDERRLGGQAGIMSSVLSVLGAAPVFYTYLLSERQRATFARPEAIRVPVTTDGGLELRPLSEVTNADATKTNWIFEFSAGTRFHDTVAADSTRFIAASRPERFNLVTEFDDEMDRLGDAVECAVLSGYHSLKREYADGTTHRDRLRHARDTLRRFRDGNDVRVQVEYGVTHYPDLRAAMREYVVPEADAVSIDTRELDMLLSDLDVDVGDPVPTDGTRSRDRMAGTAGGETAAGTDGAAGGEVEDESADGATGGDAPPAVVRRYRGLDALRERLGVDCVNFHATHYYLSVLGDGYLAPESVRRGLEFATVVAATKATNGRVGGPERLEAGATCPLSARGRDAVAALADHLGEETARAGLATPSVVAYPNRVVENPASTVGLGDAVSAVSFALANAVDDRP